MLGTAESKGMTSWFVVHRRELVKQSVAAFAGEGIRCGIVAAGFQEDSKAKVQIASIQTLAKRRGRFTSPNLIVFDECHHIAAGTWAAIYAAYPQAFRIGLTATPERLDGQGLSDWFQTIVSGPSVQTLIQQRFLAQYRLFCPPSVNLASVARRMGDYAKAELAEAVDKPTITGSALAHYQKLAAGKRALIFCVSIEHSRHVVAQFIAAGIQAAHIDGDTDTPNRDGAIRAFSEGRLQVLSNVDLCGEGFDIPAMEVVIELRPTQSLALWLQHCGRGLRSAPGKKECVILDHAGNAMKHGLPDEDRVWTLDGRARVKGKSDNPGIKRCPECFAAYFPGKTVCDQCGHVFEASPRVVGQKDGELVEVDTEATKRARLREQGRARTEEGLVALGESRGYKRPRLWARFVLQHRGQRRAYG